MPLVREEAKSMKITIPFAILFLSLSTTAHLCAATAARLEEGIIYLTQRNSLSDAQKATMKQDPFLCNVLTACEETQAKLLTRDAKETIILRILTKMNLENSAGGPKTPPALPARRRLGFDDDDDVKRSERLAGAMAKLHAAVPGTCQAPS